MIEYPPLPLTPAAIDYTWRQLANLSGVSDGWDALGLPVHYRLPNNPTEAGLFISPCSAKDIQDLLHAAVPIGRRLTPAELTGSQPLPFTDPLPLPLWGQGAADQPFAVCHPERRQLVIHADVLALTFMLLTRWEESVIPAHDVHHRFPSTASIAHRQGFLHRPLLDEIGLALQAWLKALLPGWQPVERRFHIQLSHDLDHLNPIPARNLWRETAGDFVTRRDLPMALDSLFQIITGRARWRNHLAVRELAALSERYGLESVFYVLVSEPSLYDEGYSLEDAKIRRLLRGLRAKGLVVGIHPGYETLDDTQRLKDAVIRLESALDEPIAEGRQHYLRFIVPDTWRHWDEAGLAYDSTLGYADAEGFRCSTCYPYPVFDISQDRELVLREIPLIAMDTTLRQYRKYTPEQTRQVILDLAQRCRAVNGTFTLLWHNTSLLREWRSWAKMYRQVLPELAALQSS